MDRHQSPEGLNNALSDIDRGENTRVGSEESSETKSISNTENFSDSRLAENFIPKHHSNPVIKLEALDHESYGSAKLDGKESTRVSSFDQKHTATCERTEFGLCDLKQSGCDAKNVSLKTGMDVEMFDSNGPTRECVEEQNRECDGKSRQYSASNTDVKTQNVYKNQYGCDVCGKYFSGIKSLEQHMKCHTRIKKFSCDVCDKRFTSQPSLKCHSRFHQKTIKCDICGRCFACKTSLQTHMKIHNRPASIGKCKLCDNTFKTEHLLQRHMNSFHVTQSCDICGQNFLGKRILGFHKLAHEHERKSCDFCCDTCGEIYKTVDSFRTHLELHTDEDRPFRCDICGKTFLVFPTLQSHIRRRNIHADKTLQENLRFSCDICEKSFNDGKFLEKHMNYHKMKSLFTCEICGRGYTKESSLDKHFQTHTIQIQIQKNVTLNCDKCVQTFKTEYALKNHVNNVHTTKLCDICGEVLFKGQMKNHMSNVHTTKRCDICGKEFIKGDMKQHMATHQEQHKCDVCGKYYPGIERLKRHMKCHTRIKKFSCDVCGKRYMSQESLRIHMRFHQKTIKCDICGRCFACKTYLQTHMKIHNRPASIGKCKECDNTFKTEHSLQRHMNSFHVMHSCDICGQNIPGKQMFDYHKLTHEHERKSRDFCCDTCREIYKTVDSFRTHLELHMDEDKLKPFRCEFCGKGFPLFHTLQTHIRLKNCHTDKTIHENLRFSCDVCGKIYNDMQLLEKHMDCHKMKNVFTCETCGRGYTKQSSLDKHLKTHTIQLPVTNLNCEKCDRTFKTEYALKKHEDNAHTTKLCAICGEVLIKGQMKRHMATHQEQQKCDVCGKYYPGIERLKRHMESHTRIKKFSCNVCGKRYVSHIGIRSHMRFHQKLIKCNICGRCFATKTHLGTHMRIHNRPASIGKCEICDKTFKTEGVLQRHINTFHNTNSCEICDKTFKTEGILQRHINMFHNTNSCDICGLKFKENPQNHLNRHHISNVCDICGRQFDGKLLLKYHKFAHNHEKGALDFRCHKCENIDKTVDAFHTHLKFHRKEEGSKRCQCEICGKEFHLVSRLGAHINSHRKEIEHFCKICRKMFTGTHEEHILSHEMLAKCEVCGRCFRNEIRLNKHKELHNRVELKCEQCNWMFTTKQRMQKHIERFHKPTPCDICGQELTYNEMNLHKNTMHAEDHICDVCGQSCSGLYKLKMHLEKHSTKSVKRFRCDICCKTCTTAAALQRHHRKIHSGAQTNTSAIVCDKCGKGFSKKTDLFMHLLTHKPKPHECNICGKMFSTKSTFLNHVYCRRQCQTCGKKFNNIRVFEQHVELHDTDDSEGSHGNGSLNQPPCIERSCARTVTYRKHPIESSDTLREVGDSKTGKKGTRLKKHTNNHKEQRKGQGSRTECMETIDNMQVNNPEGNTHWRESKLPYLKPREISEDSILLTKREILKLPPEKRELINDDTNFLNMVIRKSVDELDLDSVKGKQFTTVITKVKELVLNKNLDEANIKSVLKKKVTACHYFRPTKKKKLTEKADGT